MDLRLSGIAFAPLFVIGTTASLTAESFSLSSAEMDVDTLNLRLLLLCSMSSSTVGSFAWEGGSEPRSSVPFPLFFPSAFPPPDDEEEEGLPSPREGTMLDDEGPFFLDWSTATAELTARLSNRGHSASAHVTVAYSPIYTSSKSTLIHTIWSLR